MTDSIYSNITSGWVFQATSAGSPPPPGGLVLRNVAHDGHNFAKSLRLIGIWVELQEVDSSGKPGAAKKKFYPLDNANFTVAAATLLMPAPNRSWAPWVDPYKLKESGAALQFEDYLTQGGGSYQVGISAKYDAPALFSSSPNCEDAGLTVEQIFLFSRYSNNPRHEPSGALAAARCFPLIRYRIVKNANWDKGKAFTRVGSIRFDYRLHLFLDAHHDLAAARILGNLGNQAGLFADSDSVLTSASWGTRSAAAQFGAWVAQQRYWPVPPNISGGTATSLSAALFEAAEKPLPLEVTAPGLAAGFPVFQTTTGNGSLVVIRAWDNIHWWGARGSSQPLISTPGAFHAAHLHWRWGAVAKTTAAAATTRFNPDTYPRGSQIPKGNAGLWGPLVDPGIFAQSLRVAVTKNRRSLDPDRGAAASAISTSDWTAAFASGGTPDKIYDGGDIVLWYSIEVLHTLEWQINNPPYPPTPWTPQPGGVIFIHGIFFAHDAEQTGTTVGSTAPLHVPKGRATIEAEHAWFRPAQVL
jgi:hypothetical protein